MRNNDIIKLATAILFTVGLGAVSGIFTIGEIPHWYAGLNKPSFNPPNWLFGPVWTTLYLFMGISVFLVWREPLSKERNKALALFILQFILNFFWSIIFFRAHELGWALVDIIVLWVLILVTIRWFNKFSVAATWLLIPYILWVSFATLLTEAIWKLNH